MAFRSFSTGALLARDRTGATARAGNSARTDPALAEIATTATVLHDALAGPGRPRSIDRIDGTLASARPGTVTEVIAVADGVRILRVARRPDLSFVAGQHVKLGIGGDGKRHSYTIASAPFEPHLEFCIELVPGGRLSPALFRLAAGDALDVGGAKGSFVLDESKPTHLMVATVTGIAPFRSMVLDALERGQNDRFIVLQGASHADELAYREEFEGLAKNHANVEYAATVSRPSARSSGWTGHRGRVDPLAKTFATSLDPSSTAVYACGNSGMIANVTAAFRATGFPVHAEAFD